MRFTNQGDKIQMLVASADNAINEQFYFEALYIYYALIEVRFLKTVRRIGIPIKPNQKLHFAITALKNMQDSPNYPYEKLSDSFLGELHSIRKLRNSFTHDLLDDNTDYNELNERLKSLCLQTHAASRVILAWAQRRKKKTG